MRELLKNFLTGLPIAIGITGAMVAVTMYPIVRMALLVAILSCIFLAAICGLGYSIRRKKQAPQP